jgi:hypothetical protein
MSIDLEELSEAERPAGLSDLLAEIVAKREVRDALAKQLKAMDAGLERLEDLASEQLGASGLDGCRVAGRTWWLDETLYVSTADANREELIAAAQAERLNDAITVNTSTIKSFLVERAKAIGSGSLVDAVAGTKFDGLVNQYVKTRLRSRVAG